MTRFQQELSGRLGMFWKKSAEKLIQKTKEDIATGKITIDEQIAGLVQRDATISKCKAENKELTDKIASLQATIRSQEDLIRQLRAKPSVVQGRWS